MFCAPPVEAAVACGNARWGGNDRAAFPDAGGANGMAIAPCARSRAHVRRHRGAAAIDEWYAQPRRAAVFALAACPRYDFLTAPTSRAGAVLWRMSIASPSAAHARYIGDARTKAGLQEVRKNC